MKLIVIFVLVLSFNTSAKDECSNLDRNRNTRWNSLLLNKCDGLKELERKNYLGAIKFFKKGLDIRLLEFNNYDLRLELGEAYCRHGKTVLGKKEIEKFLCLNSLDLGKANCTRESLKVYCPKMALKDCYTETNFLGDLELKLKKVLKQRRLKAQRVFKTCN